MELTALDRRGQIQEVIHLRGQLKGNAFVAIVSLRRNMLSRVELSFVLRALQPGPNLVLDEVIRNNGKFAHVGTSEALTATEVVSGGLKRISENVFPPIG